MSNDKLRRQITFEAARLLVAQQESEYYRAKLTAARRLGQRWVRPGDMPTNREVRDEIQAMVRIRGGHVPAVDSDELPGDAFQVFQSLLAPLETVKQDPERHPEGDALYHSLQVFELAREAEPYDEEFQLAALLHDVGKAIDPRDHINAALTALNGHITERTRWLIEHHGEAQALREGTLGLRARTRLEAHDDFDHLMLLADCDRRGRQQGAQVMDVEDALGHLRLLADDETW
jgi:hypothetical protein